MKVLVLGAYGMLGHRMVLELGREMEVVGTCRTPATGGLAREILSGHRLLPGVDAERWESVAGAVSAERPDAVVNCVGIVKQVKDARDPVRSIRTNSLFPHLLANECAGRGVRLIHFSTDCVFSGRKGMYTLEDIPDPVDLYGRSKLLGEVEDDGCVTIRSSLIGRELGSANGLVEWFVRNKGGRAKGFRNAVFSGLTTTEMSRVVRTLLKDHRDLSGVWQVASKPISKYDLLSLVNDRLGLGIELEDDTVQRVDRSLDGSAFGRRTGYAAPGWDAMIEEMAGEAHQYDSARSRKG